MSKVVKGIKKGIKKVGKFVKKHWKPIAMTAAVAFTGGLATVGFAGFSGAMSAAGGGLGGLLSAVGSTMWAGATAAAGTFGIGSGASGAAAAASGMTGAGLFNGALAGAMGGQTVAQTANQGLNAVGWNPITQTSGNAIGSQLTQQGVNQATQQGGGGGLLGRILSSPLAPALANGAAGYFAQRGEEEDREPRASWGTATGSRKAYQPWGPDGYQAVPRPGGNGALLDPQNVRNSGPYG